MVRPEDMKQLLCILALCLALCGCATHLHTRDLDALRNRVQNQRHVECVLKSMPSPELSFTPETTLTSFLASFTARADKQRPDASQPLAFVYRGSDEHVAGAGTNRFYTLGCTNMHEAVSRLCHAFDLSATVERDEVIFRPVASSPKLPAPLPEEEHLFQNQNALRNAFLRALGLTEDQAMQQAETAGAKFERDFAEFKKERSLNDDSGAYWAFIRERHPPLNVGCIMVVYEMWGEYEQAERYFRQQMLDHALSASNAYQVLTLSHEHRTNMGAYERKLVDQMIHEHGRSGWDYSAREKLDALTTRDEAIALAHDIVRRATAQSFARRLTDLGRSDIEKANAAANALQFGESLQWATDAMVTLRSAEVLWQLEQGKTGSNKRVEATK